MPKKQRDTSISLDPLSFEEANSVSVRKAAIWARVSDPNQETENQVAQLYEWAQSRQLEVAKVYRAAASAWKGAHRKCLSEVYNDARLGVFQVIIVWALDRISREGPLATLEIVHELGRRDVEVWSYQEPWVETGGPARELLLSVAGWVAEQESWRRSERTKAGMQRARAQGKRIGRPPGSRDRRRRKKAGYFRRYAPQ